MVSSVSFRCPACGEEAQNPGDGAEIEGHAGSAEWLAAEPGPDAERRPLLAVAPAAGERHWLDVHFPFCTHGADSFWCLFRPPLSQINGWAGEPGELFASALVLCRPLESVETGKTDARLRVEVLRVLPVAEIGHAVPATEAGSSLLDLFDGPRTGFTRAGDLAYLSISVEGDAGAWAVVQRRGGRYFLILDGDWSWHRDRFRAGNRLLRPDEAALIDRLAAGAA